MKFFKLRKSSKKIFSSGLFFYLLALQFSYATNSNGITEPTCTLPNHVENNTVGAFIKVDAKETSSGVEVSGELKKWHKVTLILEGPEAAEEGNINPFLDYKLDVLFTNGEKEYLVPGYFAADGNAAETGASSGNKWLVHFTPDEIGIWQYQIFFKQGENIAVSEEEIPGTSVVSLDGLTGSFNIGKSDKVGIDNRAKGRLKYVGGHYLQYAETGEYFIKGGADSPENFLAYEDFDNTPNGGGFLKSWAVHEKDWRLGDPTWQNDKGKGMIGALNYLAEREMNAFSFITMNVNGDDKNVFPYLKYNGNPSPQEDRMRFDCSKLAQWEIVFEHAESLGLFMHFKTQEIENNNLLDGGNLGIERKVYFRELIARFGHHLAFNWNLGEENTQTDAQVIDMAAYVKAIDPYDHHIVIHSTRTTQNYINRYTGLLGDNSELTGASMQINYDEVHKTTKIWRNNSIQSGKKWVITNDEQASGVPPDNHVPVQERDLDYPQSDIRKYTLWGNLMAGGSGVEYYFGYQWTDCSDLTCQDFSFYDNLWDETRYALTFFRDNLPFWEMENYNELIGNNNDDNSKYCLAKPNEVYVIYFSDASNTGTIDLSNVTETSNLRWFNPRNGLFEGNSKELTPSGTTSIGLPPNDVDEDWVALIEAETVKPVVEIMWNNTIQDITIFEKSQLPLSVSIIDTDEQVEDVKFYANETVIGKSTTSPYQIEWSNMLAGNYELTAKAFNKMGDLLASTQAINVTVEIDYEPVANAGEDITVTLPIEIVIISGTGTDPDGGEVSFSWNGLSNNNTLILSNTSSQELVVSELVAGEYVFKLTVTDNEGNIASDEMNLLIKPAPVIENQLPEISLLSPLANTVIQEGESVTFSAEAFDSDGNISKVQFFANETLINEDSSSPYAFDWENALPGNYSIYAKVIDNEDAEVKTEAIQITIEKAPVVENQLPEISLLLPLADTVFKEGESIFFSAAAFDNDGSISKVQFFVNDSLINIDSLSPYAYNWENVSPGNYSVYAKAVDNEEAETKTEAIQITVEKAPEIENQLPEISLLSPQSSAVVQEGEDITFSASAFDNDGSIEYIQFFANDLLIKIDSVSPYIFNWENALPGIYTVYAKAIDNEKATSITEAIQITVEKTPEAISTNFILVDAAKDQDIFDIVENQKIELATLPSTSLNIRYNNTTANVKSVMFLMNNKWTRTEGVVPYAAYGDKNGNYYEWIPSFGTYKLVAQGYSEGGGNGDLLFTDSVKFEMVYVKTNRLRTESSLDSNTLEPEIDFYPNPTKEFMNLDITYPNEVPIKIDIYSFDGRLVKTELLDYEPNEILQLDLQNVKQGHYLLRASFNGYSSVKKFIKE